MTGLIDVNPENYLFQDDFEGEIMIFASDEKVPEAYQFSLAAHYDAYDRIKKFLETSIKMEGSDWNSEYRAYESLTFWDASGDSTTIPVAEAKLGALQVLNATDMQRIVTFLKDIEKESKEQASKPLPPLHLNVINSNGEAHEVEAHIHNPEEPKNGRTYSAASVIDGG